MSSELQDQLLDAIMMDDPEAIGRALSAGASIDSGRPLVSAAEFGCIRSLSHLLAIGCTMEREFPRNSKGMADHHRETALSAAVFSGRMEIVTKLLESDGKRFLEVPDVDFTATPLALASMLGNLPLAEILIRAGADPNGRDADYAGKTALDYAVERAHPHVVSMLLKAGADPDVPTWMWISARDRAERQSHVQSEIWTMIDSIPPTPHLLPDGRWKPPRSSN